MNNVTDFHLGIKVICDELQIPSYIHEIESPMLDTTLRNLKDNCGGVLLALASNCLSETEFLKDSLIEKGYNVLTLRNNLRNSSNIFKASNPDNVDRLGSDCSTVSGEIPDFFLADNFDYQNISKHVETYLSKKKKLCKWIAILCEHDHHDSISPRKLKDQLSGDIMLFDGGVEFDVDDVDDVDDVNCRGLRCYDVDLVKQRQDLEKWLDEGGILLTHAKQFRGCEAEAVILVSYMKSGNFREGPTRAVSDLCLVSNNKDWMKSNLVKHYNIHNADKQ